MKNVLTLILSALILTTIALQPASGDVAQAEQIKNSMLARKPQIETLKNAGKIGEDNKGFLAVVSGALDPAAQKIVNDENSDRTQVYAAIAQFQSTTTALVGSRRAVQLAEQAKSGHFIMNAAGKWVKK